MKKATLLTIPLILISCFLLSDDIEELSSKEAYSMLKKPSTYLIDVRTIAEYVFVGHPEMAYNIPFMFWNEREQKMKTNEKFLEDLKSHFSPEDTLIFLCRSGGRSMKAAKLAKKHGFKHLFNLKYGFEGDKNHKGYRSFNGWKNSGLPYTYELKEELIYKFK